MPRKIPWKTLEELVTILATERDALQAQIDALQASRDPENPSHRMAILLCRYLVDGKAITPVEWANHVAGWRLPSFDKKRRPTTRQYKTEDIYAAIDNPPSELPATLATLCRAVYHRHQDVADKAN